LSCFEWRERKTAAAAVLFLISPMRCATKPLNCLLLECGVARGGDFYGSGGLYHVRVRSLKFHGSEISGCEVSEGVLTFSRMKITFRDIMHQMNILNHLRLPYQATQQRNKTTNAQPSSSCNPLNQNCPHPNSTVPCLSSQNPRDSPVPPFVECNLVEPALAHLGYFHGGDMHQTAPKHWRTRPNRNAVAVGMPKMLAFLLVNKR
jgi:hypothetical protein